MAGWRRARAFATLAAGLARHDAPGWSGAAAAGALVRRHHRAGAAAARVLDATNLADVLPAGRAVDRVYTAVARQRWQRCCRWPCLIFFFVQPHLSFAVSDVEYPVHLAVMLIVGLVMHPVGGARTGTSAAAATPAQAHARLLYEMARELGLALLSK